MLESILQHQLPHPVPPAQCVVIASTHWSQLLLLKVHVCNVLLGGFGLDLIVALLTITLGIP